MIRLVTYNCHSIRNNAETVKDLLLSHDIVFLQELMIHDDDIGFLMNLNDDFEFCVQASSNKTDIISGRPSCGVAVFWRKCLNDVVEAFKVDERINGIYVTEGNNKILMINVYMPYDAKDVYSLDNYLSNLSILNDLISLSEANNVILVGDFNADHLKNTRFWKELKCMADTFDLFHVTGFLENHNFTYLCPADSATNFLDHIFL